MPITSQLDRLTNDSDGVLVAKGLKTGRDASNMITGVRKAGTQRGERQRARGASEALLRQRHSPGSE